MNPDTYYRATRREPDAYPALAGASNARVAIVGGGYAGLATALGLAERGVEGVTLLEAESIGFGASGRNGGFVFGGYSLGEAALQAQVGAETARWMYRLTQAAVRTIRARIDRYRIQCDPVDAGVIWANWFDDPEVLESRRRLLADAFDDIEYAPKVMAFDRRQRNTFKRSWEDYARTRVTAPMTLVRGRRCATSRRNSARATDSRP